jgi:uncharacterized protein YutE (UPF0331/DUF86 family)
MEEARIKRYLDKITLIEKRMNEFYEWSRDFYTDEKTKLACYKAVQEIAEAVMDVSSMIVRDTGKVPKDDYENISVLCDLGIISEEISNALKELNGLRNRIVHEYNGLNEKLFIESIGRILPCVEQFVEGVKSWLKEQI